MTLRTSDNNGQSVELVGLFSGGKDSLVACLVAGVKEVVYCRTGVGLNEEYVKEICQRFNWKLNIVEPKNGESYEDFVRRFGFPHSGIHNTVMGFLKWHPIRKWYYEQKKLGRNITYISGRRKLESARRKKMKTNKEHLVMDGMKFFSSIFNWTTEQVWEYLKEHNIERSPIYNTMHMSGDCLCGAFSQRGESAFLKMFHPELYNYLLELEKKYGSKWGNQISLTDMENQMSLDDVVCQECRIH